MYRCYRLAKTFGLYLPVEKRRSPKTCYTQTLTKPDVKTMLLEGNNHVSYLIKCQRSFSVSCCSL